MAGSGRRMIARSTPASPTDDPCIDDGTGICSWILEQTDGNEGAARAADWLVGRPLAIVVVLAGAFVFRTVARWVIRRGVRRIMVPPVAVTRGIISITGDEPQDAVTEEIGLARRRARAESLGSMLSGVASVLIWASAAISIAGILTFELGPLLAGAGFVGVAVGFGAQSLVRGVITGLFMLLEDQYGIGDDVDLGEARGTVESMSLRTTVLRAVDGTVWHVPNGEVRRVGNQSQMWSMALIDVEVSAGADLEVAKQHLAAAAGAVCERPEWMQHVLEPPEVLGIEQVRADGVTFRLMVKTSPGRQWAMQRALREELKLVLDEAGIARKLPPIIPSGAS
jgi:moderate conductance mechanosensitive channel